MSKIKDLLKRRTVSPSIGLSMLDVISNGLCATFLLFVLVASLQFQKPPVTRVMGMLYVLFDFRPDDPARTHDPGIYCHYPNNHPKGDCQYDARINELSRDYETLAPSAVTLPPQTMVYQDVNNSFRKMIVMHHPVAGVYNPRLYHTDHDNYPVKAYGGHLMLRAYFLRVNDSENAEVPNAEKFVVRPYHERINFTTEAPSTKFRFEVKELQALEDE